MDHIIIILEVQRLVVLSFQLCFELMTIFTVFGADLSTDDEDGYGVGDKGRAVPTVS